MSRKTIKKQLEERQLIENRSKKCSKKTKNVIELRGHQQSLISG